MLGKKSALNIQDRGMRSNLLYQPQKKLSETDTDLPSQSEWSTGLQKQTENCCALIFGEVSEGQLPRHVLVDFGEKAYEIYLLHPYLTLLLKIRDEGIHNYLCPGFGLLWAGLESLFGTHAAVGREDFTPCFEEMGSTLFDSIDRLEKLNEHLKGNFSFNEISFIGIEPNSLFARLAELLHESNKISHVKYWSELGPAAAFTVSRSYQATSYAFSSVLELCEWVSRSILSVHGIWFSTSGEDTIVPVFGKQLVLFSLKSFLSTMKSNGFEVLPLSSEKFTLGKHEFICVFMCVHKLKGDLLYRFQKISENDFFGIPYSIYSPPENVESWIMGNMVYRGKHANYIESGKVDASNPMFNFGNEEVFRKFKNHLNNSA